MYTDKFNFKGDHSTVAEELFSDVTAQEEKYLAVEESVEEGYFTLHEALEAYKVEEIEYLAFAITRLKSEIQHESMQTQTFKAISTVIRVFDFSINNVFNTAEKAVIDAIQLLAQGSVRSGTIVGKTGRANTSSKTKVTLRPKVVKAIKGSAVPRKKNV